MSKDKKITPNIQPHQSNVPYEPEDNEARRIRRNFGIPNTIHNDGSSERLGDSNEEFIDENGEFHDTLEEAEESNEFIEEEFDEWFEESLDDFDPYNPESFEYQLQEDLEDISDMSCRREDYGPIDELTAEELAELEAFEEEYPDGPPSEEDWGAENTEPEIDELSAYPEPTVAVQDELEGDDLSASSETTVAAQGEPETDELSAYPETTVAAQDAVQNNEQPSDTAPAATTTASSEFGTASGSPLETNVESPRAEFNTAAAPPVAEVSAELQIATPANDATYEEAPVVEQPKVAAQAPAFG